ncbi:MAG: DNA polymerase III subunit beta [Syntrophobacterales bacterium]|jgi:DNA polymerase-3 subunit beta|nr:DNA polymerase III subunit beta [Syntrophobacterales bacterium]
MNIIIDKNLISAPISKLVGITEKRSLMPILSNILISFGREKTTIYSTDLELSAISHIDYKTDEEKKIVVHGKKFLEILKEMDNGEINLEIKENTLTIRQKQTEIVLSLQEPDEFPEVREIKGFEEFSLNGGVLREIVEKVNFAISNDETRYILTGMHIKGNEGKIVVVGTDGFRMALYQKDIENIKLFKGITIPKRSMSEIERIIGDDDNVKLSIDDKHIQFSTDKATVVSRIIEGNFPDYDNVIPQQSENTAVVKKEYFLRGLRRVSSIMGRSEPVKITLSAGCMEIEAESDIGHAREMINIIYEGETMSLNFNVRFILDIVSHIEGKKIIVKVPPTYGAVLFEEENGAEYYKNIVMPIRV